MNPKGTIVIDELMIPIVDIELDNRRIVFRARITGPFPGCTAQAYTVHDRTGRVVYRTTGKLGGLYWAPVAAHASLIVVAELSITDGVATPQAAQ